MSAQSHVETLADANGDPTKSVTLRRRYAQRLRGGFGRVSAAIREGVARRDVFRIGSDTLAAPLHPSRFPRRRDRQLETFDAWLKRMQRDEVLSGISRHDNEFVRSAYGKGIRHADAALRREGIDVSDRLLQETFNAPVHRDTLELLYTRNYSDLEGITSEVSKQSNRILTEGFVEGIGPDELARRLTDRVDKIGKTRATTLARTSVIDAHAHATLSRLEQFGVDEVVVLVEHRTAGDDRVCAECAALEGTVYTIDEARGRIPVHANCRCVWIPTVRG